MYRAEKLFEGVRIEQIQILERYEISHIKKYCRIKTSSLEKPQSDT